MKVIIPQCQKFYFNSEFQTFFETLGWTILLKFLEREIFCKGRT